MKNCEDIGQWIEPIRNHFWHCCQSCDSNAEKLKVGRIFWQNAKTRFVFPGTVTSTSIALIVPPVIFKLNDGGKTHSQAFSHQCKI